MTQISKGDTFTDGEQVTGARLNQLVDSSQLLIGAITDQSAVSASSVQGSEYVLVTDSGTGTLKKAEVFDILGSSLPIVASTVTTVSATTSLVYAEPNGDILLVPYDGDAVTGKAFSSIDGSTVTVSSNAHGLDDGMFVEISATNANYNGVYRINVFNSGSFTYTVYPTVTPASGTCEYIKKASQRVAGNLFVGGRAEILSDTIIEGDLRVIGSTQFSASSVDGNISAHTAPTTGDHLTNKTYVDGDVSKLANGYVKLPNGLIMQWGAGADGAGYTVQTLTYPIAFPTAVLHIQVSGGAASGVALSAHDENNWKLVQSPAPTVTTFSVYNAYTGTLYSNPNKPYWFAIGY